MEFTSGTTVRWTNQDVAPHTVSASAFASGRLNQGDQFAYRFDTPGTYTYTCTYHPGMTGEIVVAET